MDAWPPDWNAACNDYWTIQCSENHVMTGFQDAVAIWSNIILPFTSSLTALSLWPDCFINGWTRPNIVNALVHSSCSDASNRQMNNSTSPIAAGIA